MASDQNVQTSGIGVRWARRMIIFGVLLFGLGIWATADAFYVYPKRGKAFAEWAEMQYLVLLKEEARNGRAVFEQDARVNDPVAELQRLEADEASRAARPSTQAKYDWLKALSVVGELKPENTNYRGDMGPREREEQLSQALAGRDQPAPLRGYDIPSQYFMMLIGFGFGAYILFLVVKVGMTKYRWEPATRTLTLPGGAAIRPGDLDEIDKRKWDKFIVFLIIKPGVDKVGGSSVRVDTFRHSKVEEWILEMEREAFPSQSDSPEADKPAEESADAVSAEG